MQLMTFDDIEIKCPIFKTLHQIQNYFQLLSYRQQPINFRRKNQFSPFLSFHFNFFTRASRRVWRISKHFLNILIPALLKQIPHSVSKLYKIMDLLFNFQDFSAVKFEKKNCVFKFKLLATSIVLQTPNQKYLETKTLQCYDGW